MTSTSVTPDSVEATTGLLRAELPRLEERRHALEEELTAVSGRLDSVRTALSALQALSLAPAARNAAESAPAEQAEETGPAPADDTARPEAAAAVEAAEETAAPTRRAGRTTVPKQNSGRSAKKAQQPQTAKKSATAKESKTVAAKKKAQPAEPDAAVLEAGGLTEQVLAVLTAAGAKPVRARDVAQVLGRDDSAGSVNAVRSTLDRLVATSRADRAGRGLYLSRD